MARETSWSAKGWSQVVIIALLIAVCAPLAVAAQSGPVTMQVYPTSAPNVFSSTPGWLGWVPNALYAVERDLSTYPPPGGNSPTDYCQVLTMDDRANIATGFFSWRGYADPGTQFGSAFASEYGNRATFNLHILGNGIKIKLSNLSRNMHSSDPANSFSYVQSFSSSSYSARMVGINYGPDGIKGTADDVRITSGPATQEVDELVYVGGGSAFAAYCTGCTIAQQQAAIDAARAECAGMMPFTFTTDYILSDGSGNQLGFKSGTIFFGNASLPPNLSCAKTHSGSFIQGDPGTAPGTVLVAPVAPVANATGVSGTSAPGFGPSAWQASATASGQKAELYVPATRLFGHPVKVQDIASVSWWTNKASGIPDWYFLIYTVPQGVGDSAPGQYRSRLNSEPYLSGGTYTPNAWTPWSSADATHPLRFFDALRNGGVYGTYTDPLLSAVTSAAVTWPNGATWDYRTEEVGAFSMQTGSGWSNGFTGLVDGLTVTLKSGEVATVNFEAYAAMYTITVSNAAAGTGAGPTDGSTVTVTDTLPAGLTATAFYGPGWTTDLSTLTATRTDVLGPGQSYPPLILKVAVAGTTPPSVTNHATVTWGGGAGTYTASDPTAVQQIPTHLAFTTQPSSGLPGVALSPAVVVAVQDAGNQAVEDYAGSVTLALTGGTLGAVLTGGGATATVNGVATFSGLSVDLLGTGYTLGASAPYGAGTLTGTSATFNIHNPAPSLLSMSPSTLAPGQPGFTLTVNGTGFLPGAAAYFDGVAVTTHDGSSTQLTADIPASAVAAAGSYPVTVLNPAPTAGPSNALTFSVSSPSEVWVDDDWAGSAPGASVGGHTFGVDAFATVQLAVNGVSNSGTIHVAAGTYAGTVNIENRTSLSILGAGRDTTIFRPTSTLPWNVGGYGTGRQSAIRVVNSTAINISGITLDQVTVRGVLVFGLVYWNATGTLDANRYSNTSPSDLSNYNFVAHARAVDSPYDATHRAAVAFTNSDFVDTGRVAINAHWWVNLTITGNTFRQNVNQSGTFGYAMEIGSTATGTVSGNTLSGYNVTASDGSESAGIYIENAFTDGVVTPVDKPVSVINNEIHHCQYGLWIGDDYPDPGVGSGPVHIQTTLTGNNIHHIAPADPAQKSAGIYLVDVNHVAKGSSNTLTATGNTWNSIAGPAYHFYTQGDGALHAAVTGDVITGCARAFVADELPTATTHTSIYDLAFHFCRIAGNAGAAQNLLNGTHYPTPVQAQNDWWGCNYGPGGAGAGCTSANGVSGLITVDPWLVLSLTPTPATVGFSEPSTLLADFFKDNHGATVVGGTIPDGTPVAFAGTLGTVADPLLPTAGAQASTVFTSGLTAGTGGASATVDGQSLSAVTVQNPAPTLTSMSPAILAPGQPGFTLSLTGTGFVPGATVYFSGAVMATTYGSATQLTAFIPAASVASVGTYPVQVKNPTPNAGDSGLLSFSVSIPNPVWVDATWTGSLPGAVVGGHSFGYDAFATIQAGVNVVASGGTVYVAAGTYLEEVSVARGVLLHGAGIDASVIMGRKNAGGANTLIIAGNGVTVEGFTVTREGNNPTDWGTNVKNQGVIFSQGVTGSTLRYCKVTGNRNGVYINNAQGNTIRNNVIDFNRTGMQFANNISGTVIRDNFITNNWTLGILFNFDGAGPNATTGVTVTDNGITGNWYSQVECRWTNSTATLDLSGNWLGSSTLVVRNTSATEPGYAAQIPVEYGGTAANPGGAASVGGATSGRMDYTPWLNSGTDTDLVTIGFQGDFSFLNVGAASPQWGTTPRIAEGIGLVTTGGTVKLTSGNYPENVIVAKTLSLLGPNVGKTGWDGTRGAEAVLMPTTVGPYVMDPDLSTTILRITSPDVTVDGLAFDGHNPALTGGVVMGGVEVHAACGISNWADDHDAAGAVAPNLTLKESTFTHFGYGAIDLDGGAAPQAGTVVRDNYFTSIDPGNAPVYGWGVGIILGTNYYADVLNNRGDNIRKGAQTNNFHLANPGAAVSISGNDFSTWRAGLYHNLHYSAASPFTISGNTFRAEAGSTTNKGLMLSSIQGAVGVTVQNNTVLGGFAGIEGWNLPTSAPLAIEGGSVTGAQYGILLWNNQNPGYGFSSGNAHLTVTGVTLSGCTGAGIRAFDDPANTNVPNGLSLTLNGVTATGCATGLLVDGAEASATATACAFKSGSNGVVAQNGGTASVTGSDLSGNASFGAQNLNAGSTPALTATCDWWGSASGPTAGANPGGTGSPASSGVTFASWWTTPTGSCNGTIATHLVFTVQPPAFTLAGHTIVPAVVVQALDASDNVAVGFAGTITLTLSGGAPGAILSGSSAAAVNGVATFGGLSVDLAGAAYQLNASFAGMTPAASTPFDIWGTPTVVYAKQAWTGLAAGTLVFANGGPHIVGYDAFAVIHDGLDAVASAGTVYVYPTAVPTDGYAENLTILKPLTLAKAPDAGATDVVIYPALSGPNPCSGASLCAGASNIILVQANNVTIHHLTLDGDNPMLTSGIVRDGADLDARNGIITNHGMGTSYTNLEVHHCRVKNIYLRGMYASTNGTFNFHDNTVTNVQGDYYSIGMFAWYGPGAFADNTVSLCSDAISANHSKGIQFLRNTVTDSGSGIHTDNSGDGGGVPDLIQGNTVTNSTTGGYGIWTFVPYLVPTVEDNIVTNCDVGLSAWGQGAPVTQIFRRNTVTGSGAAGSVGVYITTDIISWGYRDVSVDFQNNTISGYETGIYLTADQQPWNPGPYVALTANAAFYHNSISGNTAGLDKGTQGTYNATATCNWWGAPTGPRNPTNPLGTGDTISNGVTFEKWSTIASPYNCDGCIQPDITITADPAVCALSTGNTASVPAVAGNTYAWTITSGTITAGTATASIAYTAGTTGPVTLDVTVTTAAGCSKAGSMSVTVNPVPALDTITPFELAPGQPAFTLTLNGSGFDNGATVTFNGVDMTTTWVSATQVTAAIPAAAVSTAGTYPVRVRNATSCTSGAISFFVGSPNEVWVNIAWANGTNYPPGTMVHVTVPVAGDHYIGYDAFSSVQAGHDAVASPGTEHVLPGDYRERLVISKALNLRGPYADVNPNTTPWGSGQARLYSNGQGGRIQFLKPGSTGTTVNGLSWRNELAENIIYCKDPGINDVTIKNNWFDTNTSSAIELDTGLGGHFSGSNWTIQNNKVSTITSLGPGFILGNLSTSTVTGNSASGTADGVLLTAVTGTQIANNTFTGLTGVSIRVGSGCGNMTVDGNTVSGSAGSNTGVQLNAGATGTIAITHNTIHGCAAGVAVAAGQDITGLDIQVHNNDLSDNTYGATNGGPGLLDATCNWWGAVSGPAHSSNPLGTGVPVTNYVTFAPWSTAPPPGYTCGGTIPTHLVFTVQPSDAVAGATISPAVTVTAYDASNNPVPWFTGSVTLAIGTNPGGGMLWGTATVPAVSGVATFSDPSIDQAGVGYTLTASAAGLLGDTSAAFNVTAPSCMAPNFTSASPAPDVVGAAAQQILTVTNPQGSPMPTSFAFTWDAAFAAHTFGAASPGVPLGFWQEMRPYASPFVPTAFYPLLWIGATSAFVDVNGNGTYDPGTDYLVGLSGHTVNISRTLSSGATESQRAGYRLVLQSGIIDNPDTSGNYPVTAVLAAPCGSWTSSYSESIQPSGAGCSLSDVGNVVRLAKSGDSFTISWTDATPSACAAGYGVFASTDCKAWQAFGPLANLSITQKQVTASTELSVTYILVAEIDADSGIGPLGHYNQ